MSIDFVEKCLVYTFYFYYLAVVKITSPCPVVSTGSIILVLIVGDRFREKARCYRVSVGYSITGLSF